MFYKFLNEPSETTEKTEKEILYFLFYQLQAFVKNFGKIAQVLKKL